MINRWPRPYLWQDLNSGYPRNRANAITLEKSSCTFVPPDMIVKALGDGHDHSPIDVPLTKWSLIVCQCNAPPCARATPIEVHVMRCLFRSLVPCPNISVRSISNPLEVTRCSRRERHCYYTELKFYIDATLSSIIGLIESFQAQPNTHTHGVLSFSLWTRGFQEIHVSIGIAAHP